MGCVWYVCLRGGERQDRLGRMRACVEVSPWDEVGRW